MGRKEQVFRGRRGIHHPPVAGSPRIARQVAADDHGQRCMGGHLRKRQRPGELAQQFPVVYDDESPRLAVHGRGRGHRSPQQQFDRIGADRAIPVGPDARPGHNHIEGAQLAGLPGRGALPGRQPPHQQRGQHGTGAEKEDFRPVHNFSVISCPDKYKRKIAKSAARRRNDRIGG